VGTNHRFRTTHHWPSEKRFDFFLVFLYLEKATAKHNMATTFAMAAAHASFAGFWLC